jgi:hypothetical protein
MTKPWEEEARGRQEVVALGLQVPDSGAFPLGLWGLHPRIDLGAGLVAREVRAKASQILLVKISALKLMRIARKGVNVVQEVKLFCSCNYNNFAQ